MKFGWGNTYTLWSDQYITEWPPNSPDLNRTIKLLTQMILVYCILTMPSNYGKCIEWKELVPEGKTAREKKCSKHSPVSIFNKVLLLFYFNAVRYLITPSYTVVNRYEKN